MQALQKLHSKSKQDLEAARKQLILAVAELQRMQDTAGQAWEHAEGFDPQVNRRLLGPAPPRAVQLLDKDAAWAYFLSLLSQLQLVCDVSKVSHHIKTGSQGFSYKIRLTKCQLLEAAAKAV